MGKVVPDFSVEATGGSGFQLSTLKGKKVVLYFYPKDNTPGCTLEGQEFSNLAAEFEKQNTLVFGISRDSLKSHEGFKQKFAFKCELLSDSNEELCKLFDVIKEKNMYGKKVMGIERSTFVIDESGVLVREYRKVKAEGHAEAVLKDLKAI